MTDGAYAFWGMIGAMVLAALVYFPAMKRIIPKITKWICNRNTD